MTIWAGVGTSCCKQNAQDGPWYQTCLGFGLCKAIRFVSISQLRIHLGSPHRMGRRGPLPALVSRGVQWARKTLPGWNHHFTRVWRPLWLIWPQSSGHPCGQPRMGAWRRQRLMPPQSSSIGWMGYCGEGDFPGKGCWVAKVIFIEPSLALLPSSLEDPSSPTPVPPLTLCHGSAPSQSLSVCLTHWDLPCQQYYTQSRIQPCRWCFNLIIFSREQHGTVH